eukprot:7391945-Prymnesium_polylepis.3
MARALRTLFAHSSHVLARASHLHEVAEGLHVLGPQRLLLAVKQHAVLRVGGSEWPRGVLAHVRGRGAVLHDERPFSGMTMPLRQRVDALDSPRA